MPNAELIKALRYCGNFEDRDGCDEECPYINDKDCPKRIMCDAADALEAADKRIDGLQKLVDINTERCEALRKQLMEAHENYEKHLNELEAQIPKEGEWIEDEYGYIHCSKCGMEWDEPEHPQTSYCPNCGAKMKGENDEQIH